MANIRVLDQSTINKIAAGEVIERPASVVKELLENAIDAKSTAVTVEIKDGGSTFIRVTDNGCGIPKEEVPVAFLRHSTSKIQSVEDLFTVSSLGFRGEALSSIAAVAQVELISKVESSLTGTRYLIDGGEERANEAVGAPEGTTFLVRNLFYNTPARKKFLKSAMTEGAHVADLVEKIALSHPEISIRFIQNNQNRLHTSGNCNLKDIIYTVFGREIAANLLEVKSLLDKENGQSGEGIWAAVSVRGFIGKPVIARSNRNYENYYINGRYIKSSLISKAIEDAYKPYMMQHKYPFTMLHFSIEPEFLDVNVHPTKMELRFRDGELIYQLVFQAVQNALSRKELIPEVEMVKPVEEKADFNRDINRPEPFEKRRLEALRREKEAEKPVLRQGFRNGRGEPASGLYDQTSDPPGGKGQPFDILHVGEGKGASYLLPAADSSLTQRGRPMGEVVVKATADIKIPSKDETLSKTEAASNRENILLDGTSGRKGTPVPVIPPALPSSSGAIAEGEQLDLFDGKLLEPKARLNHKLIGQLFDTYWLIEYNDQLYIIDQHAAHEKVLYEKTMASLKSREYTSQAVSPPIILTVSLNEELLLKKHMKYFTGIGFEIEPFGGREYAVRGIPANLFSIAKKELLMEMIDGLSEDISGKNADIIYEKVASMSCKAAVKGNHSLSPQEANKLIDQLLELENPYACPHGRPTIISMSKYELEKKFKRIL